jgi:dienelactone hydrolase
MATTLSMRVRIAGIGYNGKDMEPTALNQLGIYGSWAESVASQPGRLSFGKVMKSGKIRLAEWKKQARARVREALGPSPLEAEAKAIRAQTVKSFTFDGLAIEELSWQLPYGPPTGAYFLKPEGAQEPLPGVLALHDHGHVKYFGKRKITRTSDSQHPFLEEHQRTYYGGAAWANELARRGYGVLVHDIFPFESRRIDSAGLPAHMVEHLTAAPEARLELSLEALQSGEASTAWDVPPEEPTERIQRYHAFAGRHEEAVARSLFCLGFTFPGLVLAEDLAALGILAARPDVDPDRLGCGGLRTVYLAGLDDSLDCAVAVGFMSTWRDFALYKSFAHTWMLYPPLLPRFLDFPEVLALRVPLPSLVLASEGDPLFSLEEARRAGSMLTDIYAQAGAPEKARVSFHPGPHQFNRAMQEEAFAWLDRWLKA